MVSFAGRQVSALKHLNWNDKLRVYPYRLFKYRVLERKPYDESLNALDTSLKLSMFVKRW
jgi:hypothetical protein